MFDHGGLATEAVRIVRLVVSAASSTVDVRFSTASMLARVRSLACVDSAVAGQTRRLQEVSVVCWGGQGERERAGTHVREALAATLLLTCVGLLARVGTNVHSEGTSLDEGLSAALLVALVRSLVGVNAEVSL